MAPMLILLSDTTTSDSSHKCERLTRRAANNDARFNRTARPNDFSALDCLQAPLSPTFDAFADLIVRKFRWFTVVGTVQPRARCDYRARFTVRGEEGSTTHDRPVT